MRKPGKNVESMSSARQSIGFTGRSSDGVDDVGGEPDSRGEDEENGVDIAGGGG